MRQYGTEIRGRVLYVLPRVRLMRVPDEIEVVAWHQELLAMALLQLEISLITKNGQFQEFRFAVMGQGDLMREESCLNFAAKGVIGNKIGRSS